MAQKRFHLFVSGRVQGVFYRYHVRKIARELKITGWVRNLNDGRVEIVGEGEEKNIDKFIVFCQNTPKFVRIDDIDIRVENATGKFQDFEITG